MPIYEYYCPDNRKIYQFYARTMAQGQTIPKCPDNPKFRMVKMLSPFAVTRKSASSAPSDAGAPGETNPKDDPSAEAPAGGPREDARLDAAMQAMESEFGDVDENDPRAMGRMMRRMAELTGEPIDGEMEEVVRKLEEGADPDELDEKMGGADAGSGGRDPTLYDYD